MRSSTTRSGWRRPAAARRRPGRRRRWSTAKPSLRSRVATASAIDASSSTTRIVRGSGGRRSGHARSRIRSRSVRCPAGAVEIRCRSTRDTDEPVRRPRRRRPPSGADRSTARRRRERRTLRDGAHSAGRRAPTSSARRRPHRDLERRAGRRARPRRGSGRGGRCGRSRPPAGASRRRSSRRASGRTATRPAPNARVTFQPEEAGDERGRPGGARPRPGSRPARCGPSCITTTRSASANASSWSWVTKSDREPEPHEQRAQLGDEPLAQRAVERAERLVEHEQPRRGRERAGERDPLLLAARQLARPAGARSPARPTSASASPARASISARGDAAACAARTRRCRARRGAGTARGPGT